jgi:hypothetical protein
MYRNCIVTYTAYSMDCTVQNISYENRIGTSPIPRIQESKPTYCVTLQLIVHYVTPYSMKYIMFIAWLTMIK